MEMWFGYLVGMALVALGSIWTCDPLARAGVLHAALSVPVILE